MAEKGILNRLYPDSDKVRLSIVLAAYFSPALYFLLINDFRHLIDNIMRKTDFIKIREIPIMSIICGYMAIWPVASLHYYGEPEADIGHLKQIYVMSREIGSYHDFRRANVASQVDDWCDDLYLSYYLKARYYGEVRKGITDKRLENKLIKYDIDYYFVHGRLKNNIDILEPAWKFGDLTIYKVVEPVSAG